MKDLVILGAGGLAQEMAWLVEEINEIRSEWNILGYLDTSPELVGKDVLGYPVLGGDDLARKFRDAWFVSGVGDPRLKRRVIERMLREGIENWATLVSPTVRVHPSNVLGRGVVIGRNSDLTVGNFLGDFSFLNIHVVIGHGVRIGTYTNIDPNVMINGEARIGSTCLIGANAFVRDVLVADGVTVGAGSVVVKDVKKNCVVAGVPARVIRQGAPRHTLSKTERTD